MTFPAGQTIVFNGPTGPDRALRTLAALGGDACELVSERVVRLRVPSRLALVGAGDTASEQMGNGNPASPLDGAAAPGHLSARQADGRGA
jgi:hypothetical protein